MVALVGVLGWLFWATVGDPPVDLEETVVQWVEGEVGDPRAHATAVIGAEWGDYVEAAGMVRKGDGEVPYELVMRRGERSWVVVYFRMGDYTEGKDPRVSQRGP